MRLQGWIRGARSRPRKRIGSWRPQGSARTGYHAHAVPLEVRRQQQHMSGTRAVRRAGIVPRASGVSPRRWRHDISWKPSRELHGNRVENFIARKMESVVNRYARNFKVNMNFLLVRARPSSENKMERVGFLRVFDEDRYIWRKMMGDYRRTIELG